MATAPVIDWWLRLAPYVASAAAIVAAGLAFRGLSKQIAAAEKHQEKQIAEERARILEEIERHRDATRRKLAALNFATYSMMINVIADPHFVDEQVSTVVKRLLQALLDDHTADALNDVESRETIYSIPLIEAAIISMEKVWRNASEYRNDDDLAASADSAVSQFGFTIVRAVVRIANALGDTETESQALELLDKHNQRAIEKEREK